jgi:aspartate aminotransferase
MATLDEDDEVIVPAPYWVSYPDMVRANGGSPVIVQTDPGDGYKLTADALRSAITPRSRWVILNTPGNPTGVVYTRAELTQLAEVVAEHPGLLVLSDEIYGEISFTAERALSLVQVAPHLASQVLVVNGVSKSYAMTGWRLGYALGDPELVRAMNTLQSQTSSCPSSVSQAAAAAALSGPQDFVERTVAEYRARRDVALERLAAIDGLRPLSPDGAFYIYIDCRGLMGRRTQSGTILENDQDVTLHLLEDAGVAVIQGSAYGQSPFFRISFATDIETIEGAADAIAQSVGRLTAA